MRNSVCGHMKICVFIRERDRGSECEREGVCVNKAGGIERQNRRKREREENW